MGRWRWCRAGTFSIFAFLFLSAIAFCTEVVDPGGNSTVILRHLCEGVEIKLLVPKGATDFRVQIQNANDDYHCVGPYVIGVFSCSGAGLSSNPVDVGNIVSYYSVDGSTFLKSDGGVEAGTSFKMDPLSGASLLFYVHSDVPITSEGCYFLFKTGSYVDSVIVDIIKSGSSGVTEKDYGCKIEDYCEKVGEEDTEKKECEGTEGEKAEPPKIPSGKRYSCCKGTTNEEGNNSGISGGSGSSGSQECHWEKRCGSSGTLGSGVVPLSGGSSCYYVRVCKPVSGSGRTQPSGSASGCKVNPPFAFSDESPYDYNPCENCLAGQRETPANPYAGVFTPKRGLCVGGGETCSSSSGVSTGGTSGEYYEPSSPLYPKIEGQQTIKCDAKCVSDKSKPKFYADSVSYNLGSSVKATVFVPKFEGSVDIYLAVVNVQKEEYWIITVNGETAVGYKLTEGDTIRAYATGVSYTLNEWFYLDKVIPLEKGDYRMYILVVPTGTDIDFLGSYILSYYDFKVE